MKTTLLHLAMCAPLLIAGCSRETPVPRFAGTVVAHVDSYGSGTGASHQLSSAGQMRTGFDYTDDSKTDWTADIRWTFLRREGRSDVYNIEWGLVKRNTAPVVNGAEVSFDGQSPAKQTVSDKLIISIELDPASDEA